jgi:hypothetical protein
MSSVRKVVCPSLESTDSASDERAALEKRDALQSAMSAELFELERQLQDVQRGQPRVLVASYLLAAAALRNHLNRVSARPSVIGIAAFDRLLAESTLEAYRWAVVQLAEVRHCMSGQGKCRFQPTPPDALSVFHDLSRVCAVSDDLSRERLVDTLNAIDDAIDRLIDTRTRIEHVMWPGLR